MTQKARTTTTRCAPSLQSSIVQISACFGMKHLEPSDDTAWANPRCCTMPFAKSRRVQLPGGLFSDLGRHTHGTCRGIPGPELAPYTCLQVVSDDDLEQPTHTGRNGAPAREPIYNTESLHDKLEDIAWEDAEWVETQTITSGERCQVDNVDDDLARELAFYNQALAAAQEAIGRFDEAGLPWLRPVDYYAEMIKSDSHMSKVKEQLMHEQKQIEQGEQRRKDREAKMYGKKVQQAREREKQAEKKRQIDSVSKLRKQREKSVSEGCDWCRGQAAVLHAGTYGRWAHGGWLERRPLSLSLSLSEVARHCPCSRR